MTYVFDGEPVGDTLDEAMAFINANYLYDAVSEELGMSVFDILSMIDEAADADRPAKNVMDALRERVRRHLAERGECRISDTQYVRLEAER